MSLLWPASAAPTVFNDVAPILEKHCIVCHRPGGIGPMRLDTYVAARPWAAAINEAVLARTMPPWPADPHYGKFANDPSLSAADLETMRAWVAGGAQPGTITSVPLPPATSWAIGTPDEILEIPKPVSIPARGEIAYQYIVLPQRFDHDVWVQQVEVRPTEPSVVHHAVVYIREPGSTWTHGPTTSDVLMVYTPGNAHDGWAAGMAKKIPAGSDLLIQMHYTANGHPVADRTRIALQFAKQPPQMAVLTLQLNKTNFTIPPEDPNYEIRVSGTLPQDALLLSLFPHMHLRGKAFQYAIVGNNGAYEVLLKVPRYQFAWQINYKLSQPRNLRAGTRLEATAWYDNSSNNANNPDPQAEVHYGEQSWEEMMIGFFDVAVPASVDKKTYFLRSR